MACCRANDFGGWCSSLPTQSVSGDDYCIFHAPKDDKGISIDAFNDIVFKIIKDSGDKECILSGTIFPGSIHFNKCDKENFKINLQQAEFFGEADFSGIEFHKSRFWFCIFNAFVDFRECKFLAEVDFSNAFFEKEVWFDSAKFKSVFFRQTEFLDRCSFVQSEFSNDTYFEYVKFVDANFSWCHPLQTLVFLNTDLSFVEFLGSDIRKIYFPYSALPKKIPLFLGGKLFNNNKICSLLGHHTLRDEQLLFLGQSKHSSDADTDVNLQEKRKISAADVGNIYRKLKAQSIDNHNQIGISIWHYNEKEMFRKENWFRRFFGVSFLYWAFSGYGERPLRAGISLIIWFATLQIILNLCGMSLGERTNISMFGFEYIQGFTFNFNVHKFFALLLSTLQHILFVKDPYFVPNTIVGTTAMMVFTKVIVPLQAALFIFALRNKFRR